MSGSIQLIITFRAKEDHLNRFAEIMDGVATDMLSEPGFQAATVYQNTDNPLEFVLVETWTSRSKHEEHFDRIVESGDWPRILEMLSSEPLMGYYEVR